MDDNSSCSDDDMKEIPPNLPLGSKKIKLNDGSSQESCNDSGECTQEGNHSNANNGVSEEKPEIQNGDVNGNAHGDAQGAGDGQGPSNEVVNAAPSTSHIRAFLLQTIRQRRNYRKRKTPNRDSDSSSRDSDDLSEGDEEVTPSVPGSGIETDLGIDEDSSHLIAQSDNGSDEVSNHNATDSSDSDPSFDSPYDDFGHMLSDSDSDEEPTVENAEENDNDKQKMPDVLLITKPKHEYLLLREIINREMGLTFPSGKEGKTNVIFENKFYGSLNTVNRLQRWHQLTKHRGCVNSINFHPEGNLLASGSDDMNVIVWDWARNLALQTIKTGHKSNVFQSKFLYLNARSQLNIVTCARDGQVRLLQCPPSGGNASTISRRKLASHSRAAHKLHVTPAEPHTVISAGEDGLALQADVREKQACRLFQVKSKSATIPLYSIHGHPIDTQYLVVAGRDRFVRVYDKRKCHKPVSMYCPSMFNDNVNASKKRFRISMMHLTCAIYNHDGTEILGSYNDEDIFLFDTKADVYDKDTPKEGYTRRYSGHRNSATFKGVAFFGPQSQYIVSGSDCSYIYVWEKRTGAIVQWMPGDEGGVVNCIEAHPSSPVLASSGLDKDVKIWMPTNHEEPKFAGLTRVVRENSTSMRSPLFNDFLPSLYTAWRGERSSTDEPPLQGNIEFDGNVCTAF